MNQADQQTTMSEAEFHTTPEYCSLTGCQRKWINTYLSTGDASLATTTAYDKGDPRYTRMFSHQLLHNVRINAALDKFYCRSDREKFLRELKATIAKSEGMARIRAQELYARLTFGVPDTPQTTVPAETKEEPETAAPKSSPEPPKNLDEIHTVGDVVRVDGLPRRVMAVDHAGRITDISDEVIA